MSGSELVGCERREPDGMESEGCSGVDCSGIDSELERCDCPEGSAKGDRSVVSDEGAWVVFCCELDSEFEATELEGSGSPRKAEAIHTAVRRKVPATKAPIISGFF